MNLSEHFTLEEMTFSQTAVRNGISNQPGAAEIENLKALCANVLEPLRALAGRPLHINSGYRSAELNRRIGGAATSQHCFDTETQILTERGWLSIDAIQESDAVWSLNQASGLLESVPVQSIVSYQYRGAMIRVKSLQVDLLLTPEHRMLLAAIPSGGTVEGVENFEWQTARAAFKSRRVVKTAGMSGNDTLPESMDFLKLCVAGIADGCLHWNRNCDSGHLVFAVSKSRKKEFLEALFQRLGISYSSVTDRKSRIEAGQRNVTDYRLPAAISRQIREVIGPEKHIPADWLRFSPETISSLLDTYIFFDGHSDERENCTGATITTISPHNADMLQALAVLCGRRTITSRKERTTGSFANAKPCYNLSLTRRQHARLREECWQLADYSGPVWCVNNRNGTLIARRNGHVAIVGNCRGEAADLTAPGLTIEQLIQLLASARLPVDQVIHEGTWLHVSHTTHRPNRGELLRAKFVNGKAVYSRF